MKVLTGIDIVKIERIEKSMENSRFLERVFHKDELTLFEHKKFAPQTVAGNFAVKEAFSKALGCGISGFALNEVCTLRDDNGKPYLVLYGKAKEKLGEIESMDVSISHTDTDAIAVVTILKKV